jgi:hypothetical protein
MNPNTMCREGSVGTLDPCSARNVRLYECAIPQCSTREVRFRNGVWIAFYTPVLIQG